MVEVSQADVILQALANEQQLSASLRQQLAATQDALVATQAALAFANGRIAQLTEEPGEGESAPVPARPRTPRGPRGAARLVEAGQVPQEDPASVG